MQTPYYTYNTNLQTNKTNPQKEQRYGDGNNYISFLKMKYINKLFKYVYIFPKGMCKAQQVFQGAITILIIYICSYIKNTIVPVTVKG